MARLAQVAASPPRPPMACMISSDLRNFSLRRRVGALLEVDRGEAGTRWPPRRRGRPRAICEPDREGSGPSSTLPGSFPRSCKRSQTLRVVIVVRTSFRNRTLPRTTRASLQEPAQPDGRPAEGGNTSPRWAWTRHAASSTSIGTRGRPYGPFRAQPPEGGKSAVDFAASRSGRRSGSRARDEGGRAAENDGDRLSNLWSRPKATQASRLDSSGRRSSLDDPGHGVDRQGEAAHGQASDHVAGIGARAS